MKKKEIQKFCRIIIVGGVIIKDEIKIENLIYNIRGKQVMLDSEIFVTKCHYYLYDKIITLCGV